MAVFLIVMIAALVGADLAVKYWAVNSLRPKGSIDFIHFGDFKVIDLTYLENDGAIFGSMSGNKRLMRRMPFIYTVLSAWKGK